MNNVFAVSLTRRGQSLALLSVSMIVIILLVGVVLDAGNIFWQYRQLRNFSDAAALAGAVELPQSAAARESAAEYYSKNVSKGLTAVGAEINTVKYVGSGELLYVTSPFRDDRTFKLGIPSNWAIEVRAER
ncbi:MAG: Tad domain-containing protein, partial [bacterium]|nr:Tad domain-containing protein [bacterium]